MNSWFVKNSVILGCVCWLFLLCTNAHADALPEKQTDIVFTEAEVSAIAAQGPWPMVVRPDPGNELSGLAWAEQLGQLLFNDTSLSKSGAVSCQTCHQPTQGFSDGLAVAKGEGLSVRNTQGLLNVGLQRWFGWGGGTDSLWEHEMGADIPSLANRLRSKNSFIETFLANANRQSISDEEKNRDDISLVVFAAKSIAAYIRTLQSGTTPFDEFRKALLEKL